MPTMQSGITQNLAFRNLPLTRLFCSIQIFTKKPRILKKSKVIYA